MTGRLSLSNLTNRAEISVHQLKHRASRATLKPVVIVQISVQKRSPDAVTPQTFSVIEVAQMTTMHLG